MKLTLDDVQRRVATTEDARSKNVTEMNAWQKMYDLDAGFTVDAATAIKEDGRKQVTSSDPYNVIGLAMRLIASSPKIDVPPADETDQAMLDAEQKERWLTGMYHTVNAQQSSNFVEDLKMMVFKRGRGFVQAVWIEDELPEELKGKRFPMLIRVLDPLNVGIHYGPNGADYVYNKYDDEKINVRARYPDLTQWDKPKKKRSDTVKDESNTVCVVDMWYRSPVTGKIWNCITIGEEFAKEPAETDYKVLPIIEAKGESGGKSILHSINGTWQHKCQTLSDLATGMLWAVWPHYMMTTDTGQEIKDIEIRPGATSHPPWGTKVEVIKPDMNLTVVKEILGQIDQQISQATFPGVLYGDAGGMQAGYGVNILSQAASGRVKAAQESLEMALQWLNSLVLGLVDEFATDKDGVEVGGRDPGSEKLYKACLYPKQIKGYTENAVQLKLKLPTDDQAMQTFGLRLAQGSKDQPPAISMATFREKYLAITVPSDEQDTIDSERATMHPAIQEKLAVISFMKRFPETWEAILAGTPLYNTAMQMAKFALGDESVPPQELAPPPPPMPPPGMPPMGGPPPPMGMQPNAMMAGPMGGGVPPQMQGQMTGASLGLPYHGDPNQFAQMMGTPLSPEEELQNLGGPLPPQGVM